MAAPLKMTYTNLVLQKLPEEILTKGPCGSVKNPDIFFDDELNNFAEARSICAACPLAQMCLEYALANENEGFWGGMSSEERLAINVEPVVSPETRREAAEIRAVISSGLTVKMMALKLDVTERTVYRYKAKLREELALESPTWIFSTSDTAAFVQALNQAQLDQDFDSSTHLEGDDFDSGFSQTA